MQLMQNIDPLEKSLHQKKLPVPYSLNFSSPPTLKKPLAEKADISAVQCWLCRHMDFYYRALASFYQEFQSG